MSVSSEKEVTSIDDIRFICSRCKQILHLDPSFSKIDEQTFFELINTAKQSNLDHIQQSNVSASEGDDDLSSEDSEETPSQENTISTIPNDRNIAQTEDTASSDSTKKSNAKPHGSVTSFTMVGDVTNTSTETFSHKLNMIVNLFDVISSNTLSDHPLCEECNDQFLDQLDKELKETQSETDLYLRFAEELKLNSPSAEELKALGAELDSLKNEEKSLLAQLEETEKEREATKEKIENMRLERGKLEIEEQQFLKEYAEFRAQQLEVDEEQRSVDNLLRNAEFQLKRLRKTNVFNATFHIWHQGPFGTINGFRLGRLPNQPVDWDEINAAWGQTTLLLASLIKKIGLKLERFRLVPFGNHSYIETLDNKPKELPLYGSSGFRLLWDTKFDNGMIAFLDCLQQFKEEVERSKRGFKLPYKMEKGKIEDPGGNGDSYLIKLQFNSEENWTKALKFMLTNLKWGLAWVSSEFPSTSESTRAGTN